MLIENVTILFLTAKIRKKDENTKGCGNFFNKYVVKTRCLKPYNLTTLQSYTECFPKCRKHGKEVLIIIIL